MAFVKTDAQEALVARFNSFDEARETLVSLEMPTEKRIQAAHYIIRHQEFYSLLEILQTAFNQDREADHPVVDYIFSQLPVKPSRDQDYQLLFALLQSDNAYLRNAVIHFLQTYEQGLRPYLEALFQKADRDVRIFIVNILGDMRLEASTEILHSFIAQEVANQKDINVIMTAVDYLGEIGTEQDIALLEAVKQEFASEPYVAFGVEMAINRIKGV